MKRKTLKKHHRWFGLIVAFFILMFSISGIILNHRIFFSHIDLSRAYLPSKYQFSNWNGGLLRGTIEYSPKKVLVYGNAGVFLKLGDDFIEFNNGFPKGVDCRNVRRIVRTQDSTYFALTPFGLYKLLYTYRDNQSSFVENLDYIIENLDYRWEKQIIKEQLKPNLKRNWLTDILVKDDSLIVSSRSNIYVSTPPYTSFTKVQLKPHSDYDGKVSLFKTVWLLHSGEMFGLLGRLIVDSVAIIFIILSITGVLYWFLPKTIKKSRKKAKSISSKQNQSMQIKTKSLKSMQIKSKLLKVSFSWHRNIGRLTIFFLLFIVTTGWFLRPPMILALIYGRLPAIPMSELDSKNPWNDKIRLFRYDEFKKDWLLSTSEGIYSIANLDSTPKTIEKQPPVSVMGLNVFEQFSSGEWICGSFSGIYSWNRNTDQAFDFITGKSVEEIPNTPFGKTPISGFSNDFSLGDSLQVIVDYNEGTAYPKMPKEFSSLPISLWNLGLEVHTGRIYTFLGRVQMLYIFFIGISILYCLITGYKILRKK